MLYYGASCTIDNNKASMDSIKVTSYQCQFTSCYALSNMIGQRVPVLSNMGGGNINQITSTMKMNWFNGDVS